MEDLTDLIKNATPKNVRTSLKKDGTSKFWGYYYPPRTHVKLGDEEYCGFCISALNDMERKLIEVFGSEYIVFNERDRSDQEVDEKDVELKMKVSEIGAKILKIPFSLARKSIDMFDTNEPEQQRLIIFEYGGKRKISFSVSNNRHLRQHCDGAQIFFPDKGYTSYEQMIPILIGFHGFESAYRDFKKFNERLSTTVFGPIWRGFPFVEDTIPSTLYKSLYNYVNT